MPEPLWKQLVKRILAPVQARELHRRSRCCTSFGEHFDLTQDTTIGSSIRIRAFQAREEIIRLLELIERCRCQRLLEVGTARGGTLYLLCRAAVEDATIVSVDLPRGRFGGGYPFWLEPVLRSFPGPDQNLILIKGDSGDPAIIRKISDSLQGPADFVLIDGDHSYGGVKRDFQNFKPLVREGGLLAFHDIVPGSPDAVGGVPDFWQEVKKTEAETLEIVESWDQGGYGIGVVVKREQP